MDAIHSACRQRQARPCAGWRRSQSRPSRGAFGLYLLLSLPLASRPPS